MVLNEELINKLDERMSGVNKVKRVKVVEKVINPF
jgi:hypothetical protein